MLISMYSSENPGSNTSDMQDNTMMAGADEFHIEIQGRGGHGENPLLLLYFSLHTHHIS